jgi:hypothetical protein
VTYTSCSWGHNSQNAVLHYTWQSATTLVDSNFTDNMIVPIAGFQATAIFLNQGAVLNMTGGHMVRNLVIGIINEESDLIAPISGADVTLTGTIIANNTFNDWGVAITGRNGGSISLNAVSFLNNQGLDDTSALVWLMDTSSASLSGCVVVNNSFGVGLMGSGGGWGEGALVMAPSPASQLVVSGCEVAWNVAGGGAVAANGSLWVGGGSVFRGNRNGNQGGAGTGSGWGALWLGSGARAQVQAAALVGNHPADIALLPGATLAPCVYVAQPDQRGLVVTPNGQWSVSVTPPTAAVPCN